MARYCWYLFFLVLSIPAHGQLTEPHIIVLGVAQDGGYPHMGCTKKCCNLAWANDSMKRYVVSLALVDPASKKWWLFEATPDIKYQLHYFQQLTNGAYPFLPEGIFITHAHIGHYTGLMELGREVMNTNDIPVYVLPRLKKFLETNGPWSQLVSLHNIALHVLNAGGMTVLPDNIGVAPFVVPHRNEYSETAGFRITTPGKSYLFIPDINKWKKWTWSIVRMASDVDVALLDATFYDSTELPGRNMNEVPHPFVTETMDLFKNEPAAVKSKIHFIHMNHTNPLLWDTDMQRMVEQKGFQIAHQGSEL